MRFDGLNRNKKILEVEVEITHTVKHSYQKKIKRDPHIFVLSLKSPGIRESIMLILQRARVEPEAWKMLTKKYP